MKKNLVIAIAAATLALGLTVAPVEAGKLGKALKAKSVYNTVTNLTSPEFKRCMNLDDSILKSDNSLTTYENKMDAINAEIEKGVTDARYEKLVKTYEQMNSFHKFTNVMYKKDIKDYNSYCVGVSASSKTIARECRNNKDNRFCKAFE